MSGVATKSRVCPNHKDSPRLSVQCVAAARSAPCLKVAMRLAVVCVNQSFRVLDVSSANLDSTHTPTVKVNTRTQKCKCKRKVIKSTVTAVYSKGKRECDDLLKTRGKA